MKTVVLSVSTDLAVLRSFAESFFDSLGTSFEERNSTNYADETYFRANKNGLEFSIWASDDTALNEPFLIEISSNSATLEELTSELKRLKKLGFHLWRINNFGKSDQSRVKL